MNDEVIGFTDRTANRPIARYLNQKGVAVINLTEVLQVIPEKKRVVSKLDPHPSKYTNNIIADTMKVFLRSQKFCEE